MPKGDPAGYLPNVVKSRKRRAADGGAANAYASRKARKAAGTFKMPKASNGPRSMLKPVRGFGGRNYSAYAPDQGGPPPRPGSSQEKQNRADRARAKRRGHTYMPRPDGPLVGPYRRRSA